MNKKDIEKLIQRLAFIRSLSGSTQKDIELFNLETKLKQIYLKKQKKIFKPIINPQPKKFVRRNIMPNSFGLTDALSKQNMQIMKRYFK